MSRHVLRATDQAFKAFLESELSPDSIPAANILRHKEVTDKNETVLICAAESATRGRAKNWAVSGSLMLKSVSIAEPGEDSDNLAASDDLEAALLNALEQYIPDDDRPQPLAAAIQAAAVAAAAVDPDKFLINDCRLTSITQGFDEQGIWTLSVDYTASVIFTT